MTKLANQASMVSECKVLRLNAWSHLAIKYTLTIHDPELQTDPS